MTDDQQEKIDTALKRINGYAHIRRRLLTCGYCLEQLRLHDSYESSPKLWDTRQSFFSLYESMIISYISCYNNNSSGKTKLNKNKVYRGMSDLLTFHDSLYIYRNKLIAHNEYEIDKTLYIKDENGICIYMRIDIGVMNEHHYDLFYNLINTTYDFIYKKVNEIACGLEKEIGIKVRVE
nr:hypothetical protein [uncultured Neokomagataea sp.]